MTRLNLSSFIGSKQSLSLASRWLDNAMMTSWLLSYDRGDKEEGWLMQTSYHLEKDLN